MSGMRRVGGGVATVGSDPSSAGLAGKRSYLPWLRTPPREHVEHRAARGMAASQASTRPLIAITFCNAPLANSFTSQHGKWRPLFHAHPQSNRICPVAHPPRVGSSEISQCGLGRFATRRLFADLFSSNAMALPTP